MKISGVVSGSGPERVSVTVLVPSGMVLAVTLRDPASSPLMLHATPSVVPPDTGSESTTLMLVGEVAVAYSIVGAKASMTISALPLSELGVPGSGRCSMSILFPSAPVMLLPFRSNAVAKTYPRSSEVSPSATLYSKC